MTESQDFGHQFWKLYKQLNIPAHFKHIKQSSWVFMVHMGHSNKMKANSFATISFIVLYGLRLMWRIHKKIVTESPLQIHCFYKICTQSLMILPDKNAFYLKIDAITQWYMTLWIHYQVPEWYCDSIYITCKNTPQEPVIPSQKPSQTKDQRSK